MTDPRLTLASTWYGKSIPQHFGHDFQRFCVRSASIAAGISHAPINVTSKYEFAHTDGKTIFLPTVYFIPEYTALLMGKNPEFTRNGEEEKDLLLGAITVINGSTCHEALHIELSECDLRKACVGNEKAEKYIEHKVFVDFLQIVEDIFIEHYAKLFFRNPTKFIVEKNAILLGEEMLEGYLETMQPNLSSIVPGLSYRKNRRLDRHELWSTPPFSYLVPILDKAKDPDLTVLERVEIAVELFEAITQDDDVEQDVEAMASPDELMLGIPLHGQEFDPDDKIKDELAGLEKALNSIIERESERRLFKLSGIATKQEVAYTDVFDAALGYRESPISPDEEFKRIGTVLRYMREEKHLPGRARDTGTKIVKNRLHRIQTDGKVLAYRDRQDIAKGKPEIIWLLDFSGSMSSMATSTLTRYQIVSKAALGAFESLTKAGIPTAFYGHTSRSEEDDSMAYIFGIAAFQMPLGPGSSLTVSSDYVARFNRAVQVSRRENFDGYAIEFVSKLFTSRPGTKMIYVLSDGQPVGSGYPSGMNATQYTKYVAETLRRKRIAVISMSLDQGVMKTNNEIYGHENNIEAFGGDILGKISEVIQKVAMEFWYVSTI